MAARTVARMPSRLYCGDKGLAGWGNSVARGGRGGVQAYGGVN